MFLFSDGVGFFLLFAAEIYSLNLECQIVTIIMRLWPIVGYLTDVSIALLYLSNVV